MPEMKILVTLGFGRFPGRGLLPATKKTKIPSKNRFAAGATLTPTPFQREAQTG